MTDQADNEESTPPPSFLGWRHDVDAMPEGLAKRIGTAALTGDTMTFELNRVEIVEGLTFSRAAFDATMKGVISFVEARCMARWDQTNEPPSHLKITVTVEAA